MVARGAVFAAAVVAVVGCCTRAYAQEPGALPLIFSRSRSARSAEGPAAAAVWKFCFIDVERTVRPIVNCLLSPPPPPPPPPLLGLAEAAESYEIFRTTCEGQIRFMEGTPFEAAFEVPVAARALETLHQMINTRGAASCDNWNEEEFGACARSLESSRAVRRARGCALIL
jgi:hypothetical protein